MTRSKDSSSLLALWQEASKAGEDGFRQVLQQVVQRILEEELTAFLRAAPSERTTSRRGYRNGYKPRSLKTRVGTLDLMVPKDREGRFQTELFDRYQRSEKALVLAIIQMYLKGVSTRKVKSITEKLCGLDVSRSQVSSLTRRLEEDIQSWRNRMLEKSYPYLVVDARYEKVRRRSHVVSQGVLIVLGIDEQGYREILGVWIADTESEASWSEVFNELKMRGLGGVRYIVSDDHKGMRRAIDRHFQGVHWQRCQVHFVRNVLARVRTKDRKRVLELLRAITQSMTRKSAAERLREAVEVLDRDYPKVARMLEEQGEEILAVYELPETHRVSMRSTNMLERFNEEIKRRTRVVRIFPDTGSCVRLISALAIEANEEWMHWRYLVDMNVQETDSEEESGSHVAVA